jgi:hypothetical protein
MTRPVSVLFIVFLAIGASAHAMSDISYLSCSMVSLYSPLTPAYNLADTSCRSFQTVEKFVDGLSDEIAGVKNKLAENDPGARLEAKTLQIRLRTLEMMADSQERKIQELEGIVKSLSDAYLMQKKRAK